MASGVLVVSSSKMTAFITPSIQTSELDNDLLTTWVSMKMSHQEWFDAFKQVEEL